ncbi:hypothetical protein BJ741DRAFT_609377 [Chytriomyces cf. hyalinus JEL632]|nr:hypothetical protein BJ741DRAFT_609377 [Chytriomyces cf. hyalinus JEL632]
MDLSHSDLVKRFLALEEKVLQLNQAATPDLEARVLRLEQAPVPQVKGVSRENDGNSNAARRLQQVGHLQQQISNVARTLSNDATIMRVGAARNAFMITNNGSDVIIVTVDAGSSQRISPNNMESVGSSLASDCTYMLTIIDPETHQKHVLFAQPGAYHWKGFAEVPKLSKKEVAMLCLIKQLTNAQADIILGSPQAHGRSMIKFTNQSAYPVTVSANQDGAERVLAGCSANLPSCGAFSVVVIRDTEANLSAFHYGPSCNIVFRNFVGLPTSVRLNGGFFMTSDSETGLSFGRDIPAANNGISRQVSMSVKPNQLSLGSDGWNFTVDSNALRTRCHEKDHVSVNRDTTKWPRFQVEGSSRVNGQLLVAGDSRLSGSVFLPDDFAIVTSNQSLKFKHGANELATIYNDNAGATAQRLVVNGGAKADVLFLGNDGWNLTVDNIALRVKCHNADHVVFHRDTTKFPRLQVEGSSRVIGDLSVAGGTRMSGELSVGGGSRLGGSVHFDNDWALIASTQSLKFKHGMKELAIIHNDKTAAHRLVIKGSAIVEGSSSVTGDLSVSGKARMSELLLGNDGWNVAVDNVAMRMRCYNVDHVVIHRDTTSYPTLQVEASRTVMAKAYWTP